MSSRSRPARRDVGRDEHADVAVREPLERAVARLLSHVAVQRRAPCTPCAFSWRASESTVRFVFTNTSVSPSSACASSISFVELVVRRAPATNRWSASSTSPSSSPVDLVAHGVARVDLGDPPDRAVERRREEHRLAVLRAVAARSGRPAAGTPCRASGRPRRAPGSGRRRASTRPRGRRGPAAGRASRSGRGRVSTPLRLLLHARPAVDRPSTRRPRRRGDDRRTPRSPAGRARASGTRIERAAGAASSSGSSRSTMGMAKPRVLPEPVFERARVSRPAVASSTTIAWIGNGAVMPRAASASTTGSETPRSRKVWEHVGHPHRLPRPATARTPGRTRRPGSDTISELRERERLAPLRARARAAHHADPVAAAGARRGAARTTAPPRARRRGRAGSRRRSRARSSGPRRSVRVDHRTGVYAARAERAEQLAERGERQRRPHEQPRRQVLVVGRRPRAGGTARSRRRSRAAAGCTARRRARAACSSATTSLGEYPRSNTSRSSFHRWRRSSSGSRKTATSISSRTARSASGRRPSTMTISPGSTVSSGPNVPVWWS